MLLQTPVASSLDWEAAGHAASHAWTSLGARFGPWIFAALMLALVLRALLRASRYDAVDAIRKGDQEVLKAAVEQAETRTDAEIIVVVVEASDDHPDAPWKAAAATLAVGTLLLAPRIAPLGAPAFILTEALLFTLGFALALAFADFRRSFLREKRATEVAEEQALQELQRLDVTSAKARNAVLLFVSVFEQRAIVLADEAAHAAAPEGAWTQVDATLVSALRTGSTLCAALEQGIESLATVLERALPRTAEGSNRFDDDVEIRRR